MNVKTGKSKINSKSKPKKYKMPITQKLINNKDELIQKIEQHKSVSQINDELDSKMYIIFNEIILSEFQVKNLPEYYKHVLFSLEVDFSELRYSFCLETYKSFDGEEYEYFNDQKNFGLVYGTTTEREQELMIDETERFISIFDHLYEIQPLKLGDIEEEFSNIVFNNILNI